MQFRALHPPLFQFPMRFSLVPKRGGGGTPVSTGPATPSCALSFASLNMRRLWHRDSSVHDGFHMLCAILQSENVGVCCIQETSAGAFPTLPVDHPYQYDGPSESYGREAGFLIRSGVSCTPVPGIQDSVSMRWRIFGGVACVCSFYAPHVGIPEADRVSFWPNLIEATRHVRLNCGPSSDSGR